MGMKELKRCPFCGGEAKLNHEFICGNLLSFIECSKCFVRSDSYTKSRLYNPDEKAAEVWNRRVNVE